MRRSLLLVALLVAAMLLQHSLRGEPSQVPVLLYHNLTTAAGTDNAATLPVHEFAAQMAWLHEHGYSPITTEALADWLHGKGRLPPKPVLITFDDGYQSNYDLALPLLETFGMKATIFIISSYTGRRVGQWPHLSGAELRKMVSSGVIEVQAHSHDGHRQGDGDPVLVAWTEQEVEADLAALSSAFTADDLALPTAFAYPFGAYDDDAMAALEQDGYNLGFTVEPGYVRPGDSRLQLKRLIVYPETSLCRFAQMLEGSPPAGGCPP